MSHVKQILDLEHPNIYSVLKILTAPISFSQEQAGLIIGKYVGDSANLVISNEPRSFYVWLDMNSRIVSHHVNNIRGMTSLYDDGNTEPFVFVPNPAHKGMISIFQNNLMRSYVADSNLELSRQSRFAKYPSRLHAIFLLQTKEEAVRYRDRHLGHVQGRVLRSVTTEGYYAYSIHDSSWVDFLRLEHSLDPQSLDNTGNCYWSGDLVKTKQLSSFGSAWSKEPIMESLFIGRLSVSEENEVV